MWDGAHAYIFGGYATQAPGDQIVRYDPATGTVTVVGATLPIALRETSAVWDGTNAYIFGGHDGSSYLNQIVRYTPSTNTVTTMAATLPTGRYGTSAVWDGTHAYIFGGWATQAPSDQIVRYDPATDAATVMSATLPSERARTSAVWDGTYAYIFGGYSETGAPFNGGYLNEIIRYDPATDIAIPMVATLPTRREVTSAVWDGTHAYVFGGAHGYPLDQIDRYDPATDTATTMSATLPWGRGFTSAVWDGTHAYIFGGYNPYYGEAIDQIVGYDPTTNTATTPTATLPAGVYSSAAWDGRTAYVFGGQGNGGPYGPTNRIVQYDPAMETTTIMSATLPTGRHGTSAVWDGTNAYIFGGSTSQYCCSQRTNEIVRYDPTADAVTIMTATLPTAQVYTSAVWDGTHAYIFGGLGGPIGSPQSCCSNQIVQYDPATDTATLMSATLPTGRHGTSAVWDGTHAYIFGGSGPYDQIVRYDVATNTVTVMSAALPTPSGGTSAVWDGSNAYVFGGSLGHRIVRYNPVSGPPQYLVAVAGAEPGKITLSWQPPAADTYGSQITGYRIYRGSTSGAEGLLVDVGDVRTYTDWGLPGGAARYYRVSAVSADGEGARSHAVRGVASGLVLAFGDSVAAGHGLGGMADGYPNNDERAFPGLLATLRGDRAANFAISGACTASQAHVLLGAHPETPDSCTPGRTVLDQIARYSALRKDDPNLAEPSLVLLSVGSNDIEFRECYRSMYAGEGAGPCGVEELDRNLEAYRHNLGLVAANIRTAIGASIPVVTMAYYNPFPDVSKDGELTRACEMFRPMALAMKRDLPTLVYLSDEEIRQAQVIMRGYSSYVLRELNTAITDVVDEYGFIVARPDFADHDMCRSDRDSMTGEAFDPSETWAFPLHYDLTTYPPFSDPESYAFPRPGAPAASAPLCPDNGPDDPQVAEDGNSWFAVRVVINCTPHPTSTGHAAIARSIESALAQG